TADRRLERKHQPHSALDPSQQRNWQRAHLLLEVRLVYGEYLRYVGYRLMRKTGLFSRQEHVSRGVRQSDIFRNDYHNDRTNEARCKRICLDYNYRPGIARFRTAWRLERCPPDFTSSHFQSFAQREENCIWASTVSSSDSSPRYTSFNLSVILSC